jgi:hypothetical protein
LVTRLREAGVDAMFRWDEHVPWEVRCALEDLLFQVGQKDSEIAHLKRRTEAMAKATKVRHREDEQEGPPSKRREYAADDRISRTPSAGISSASSARVSELQPRLSAWSIGERTEDRTTAPAAETGARDTRWPEQGSWGTTNTSSREARRPASEPWRTTPVVKGDEWPSMEAWNSGRRAPERLPSGPRGRRP